MNILIKVYDEILKKSFNKPIKVIYWNKVEKNYGKGDTKITMKINEPLKLSELKKDPTLALAEAYMDKKIEIEGSLKELMLMAFASADSFTESEKYKSSIKTQRHDREKSLEDVQYHYDIGNDFYRLWLDEGMNYSCAYFKQRNQELEAAQIDKNEHILKKLRLKSSDNLLDIGCGWGNLIIMAAKNYGVKAKGLTLSKQQYEMVNRRIEKENLTDRVKVALMDYRDTYKLKEKFEKIVSVGMFEHVGRKDLPKYIECINNLLNTNGLALIHGITNHRDPDDETMGYNSFLNKYIFPGGYIPSVPEIVVPANKLKLKLIDLESLRLHYKLTLENWHKRFMQNWDQIEKEKGERFMRMWDIYLQSCAAVFESGNLDVIQYLFEKGTDNDRPLTREYML